MTYFLWNRWILFFKIMPKSIHQKAYQTKVLRKELVLPRSKKKSIIGPFKNIFRSIKSLQKNYLKILCNKDTFLQVIIWLFKDQIFKRFKSLKKVGKRVIILEIAETIQTLILTLISIILSDLTKTCQALYRVINFREIQAITKAI